MPIAFEDVLREEADAAVADAHGRWGEAIDVFAVQEGVLQFLFSNSDVVFWRVPSELTSRHAPLLLGKQIAKEIFRALPELESFVRIQDQRLHACLGLLTTRFPNGFDG